MQLQSKGQEQVGKPCQEIGGKIGKVTIILTDNPYLLRSPPVTVVLLCPTMSLLLIGLLARPIPVPNSVDQQYYRQFHCEMNFLSFH